MPQGRYGATSVTVPGLGVLVMGGYDTAGNTSDLLRNGGSSWEEGPVLPGKGAGGACSVAWEGSVILVGGVGEWNQVREYSTVTGEWEEESKWPQLGGRGRFYHACGLLHSQLVVAGGGTGDGTVLDTTVTLDLTLGPGAAWVEGGRLKTPRYGLAMVPLGDIGKEKLYVLGGEDDRDWLDTVEVWREASRTWQEEEERLPERRGWMAAGVVDRVSVCPT